MLPFNEFATTVTNSQMAITSVVIIIYLIVIELISTSYKERETQRVSTPLIIILIALFILIVIKKVAGILK